MRLLTLTRARTALIALVTLASAASVAALPSPAAAASGGYVVECSSASTSCLTFSGYTGRSVWHYPVSSSGNNCTNYAAHRLARNGATPLEYLGNAGSWADSARKRGIRVDSTPAVGSIAQWSYGSRYAPTYGHVGYVEEVSATSITISDSAYSGGSKRWRVARDHAFWPNAFIHAKDVGYQPPPSGSFVRVRETGVTYRLIGAAPVVVTTWGAYGGRSYPTHLLSSASLASLPSRVSDGTMLRSGQTGQIYRVAGGAPVYVPEGRDMGLTSMNGANVDQAALDRAGSSSAYARLSFRPRDEVLVRAGTAGRFYLMRGGYAYAVHSWDQIGGRRAWVVVDPRAVAGATTTGAVPYRHLAGLRTL